MSILTVNLKHYYERHGLWLIYVFLGIFVFACIAGPLEHPKAGKGEYIGLVVLALVVGFLVSITQIEVLTKPFSYCLGGQREVVRKLVFSVGVVVNLLGSMLFLTYPGLHPLQRLVVVCSAFFAGATFYMLGVALAFAVRNSAAVFGFLPLLIVGRQFFGLHVILEWAIAEKPYAVVCVGVLSGAAAWLWLSRTDLARRYCNVPRISILDCCNREKLQKYNLAKKLHGLKDHPRPWVERFFLGRMDKYDYLGVGRYVWGGLYNNFGMIVSRWKGNAVGLLLLTTLLGYMGPGGVFMLAILPLAMLSLLRSSVYSSMLISGGRRQKFTASASSAGVGAAFICVIVLIVSGLSMQLARFMPDIALRGGSLTLVFMGVDARFVFVPLVIAPFALTMQLVFYRKRVYMVLSLMLLFPLIMVLGIVWRESLKVIIMDPICVGSMIVLGWLVFFLVLRHICDKRCLVGQGRW